VYLFSGFSGFSSSDGPASQDVSIHARVYRYCGP
jgi:hypothetical protein